MVLALAETCQSNNPTIKQSNIRRTTRFYSTDLESRHIRMVASDSAAATTGPPPLVALSGRQATALQNTLRSSTRPLPLVRSPSLAHGYANTPPSSLSYAQTRPFSLPHDTRPSSGNTDNPAKCLLLLWALYVASRSQPRSRVRSQDINDESIPAVTIVFWS